MCLVLINGYIIPPKNKVLLFKSILLSKQNVKEEKFQAADCDYSFRPLVELLKLCAAVLDLVAVYRKFSYNVYKKLTKLHIYFRL